MFKTKKTKWIKKSSKNLMIFWVHDAHEQQLTKQKNYQSKNMRKEMNLFDTFWNILKQFNILNVNFELIINDLKQISIVWNLFLTKRCWFETMKNNNFDYLIKRFETNFKRQNQSNIFFDEFCCQNFVIFNRSLFDMIFDVFAMNKNTIF